MRCQFQVYSTDSVKAQRSARFGAACAAVIAALCLQACGGGGDEDEVDTRSVAIPTPPRVPAQLSV